MGGKFAQLRVQAGKINYLIGSQRRRLVLLFPLYLLSSCADLIGISMLVYLVTALQDTESPRTILDHLPFIPSNIQSLEHSSIIVTMSILVFFSYILKSGVSYFTTRMTLIITFRYGAVLRSFLMAVYQTQSYTKFISRNSSEYIYNVNTLAGRFVTYSVQPLLRIFGEGLLIFLMFVYLALADPFVMLILVILLLLCGAAFDRFYRRKMSEFGLQENKISTSLIKSISQAVEAYKESHIFGIREFFHREVKDNAFQQASLRIRSQLIIFLSRHVLEVVVVLSVLTVIVVSILSGRDVDGLFVTLTLFLVAAMRLVPATTQIVTSIANLRFGAHSLDVLYSDMVAAGHGVITYEEMLSDHDHAQSSAVPKTYFRSLEFVNVSFRYSSDRPQILNSMNMEIKRNDFVGIVGESGSGKTTAVALMLGFLEPTTGSINVDGAPLSDPGQLQNWWHKIAYLPQEVLIIDDTLANNIALGVHPDKVDQDKLRSAASKASLNTLVDQMPDGFNTRVGEAGQLISGGQRQRVALARAFYHDAQVLMLDEATSALDLETEKQILNQLKLMKGKITLVVVSHRRETLDLCNKVIRLSDEHDKNPINR